MRRIAQQYKRPIPSATPLNLLVWIALTLTIVTACESDEGDFNSQEELELKDVSYGQDPRHTLDLHLPAGRTTRTRVIVFIHGGGWHEGSKEQFDAITGQFVQAGFATASINYRYADVKKNILYTDLLKDVDDALLFLKQQSGGYVFNGNDVVLFGHSAGAHLALLYTYRDNSRSQVRAVISLSAPTNLKRLMEEGVFPEVIYNLVGSESPEKYIDASPVSHIRSGVVPTYVFHGREDLSIPYAQAEELYNALSNYTTASRFKLVDEVGHEFSEDTYPLIVQESINFAKY
jgi:acetyl esterase/lipase